MKNWIIPILLIATLSLLLNACVEGPSGGEWAPTASPEPDTFAYQHLLPDGINLKLPDVPVDSSLVLRSEENFEFDCFLGYDDQATTAKAFALGLSSFDKTTFSSIVAWKDTVRSTMPENQRNKIWINLWIDEDIPYYALHYLEANLRFAGFLKLYYRNLAGESLPIRLPPLVENECHAMGGRPCLRKRIISKDRQDNLQAMNLGADWAPVIRYEDFVLRPENVYDLRVEPNGQLLLEEDAMSPDSLYESAYDFLTGPGTATKKIFKVRVAEEVKFHHFLRTQSTLKLVYQNVWEEVAQSMFSKPYAELERREMIEVRSKWPIVIWLDKQ